METRHLIAVEKWTFGLAAAAIVVSFLLMGRAGSFAVAVGAGIMTLNAWALRRIGERAIRTFKRPGAAILLFNAKMVLLIALVFVIIRYFHVDPIGFVVGISIFPVAILAVALQHALAGPHDPPADEEMHG